MEGPETEISPIDPETKVEMIYETSKFWVFE